MKKGLSILSAALALIIAQMPHAHAQETVKTEWSVEVFPDKTLAPISPLFWGTNCLFWVDDDDSLSDGRIEAELKALPCRILRYPGGTVADNWHWRTNLLDNKNMFPYEDGEQQTDFDEFMAFCRRVGAEPMLVVNTQSWFLKQDIAAGAEEAADWVRYCKERGYRVKYWEIGNETYWHNVMTASEYGRLAKTYAEAMKAVDPDIIVSINGGWDINMTGNKERTDPALWEQLRKDYLSIASVAEAKAMKEKVDSVTVKPWTEGTDKWWHDLIGSCGEQIDMVSVHWYFHDNTVKNIDTKIKELKAILKELKPDKDFVFCLSEYNCNTDEFPLRVTGLAESIGRFLNCGIDIACQWPLRIGGRTTSKNCRSLLSLDTKEHYYPYQIYQTFQKALTGDMIQCSSSDKLYAFASRNGSQVTLVVSGRRLKQAGQVSVSVGPTSGKAAIIGAERYSPDIETLSLTSETVGTVVADGKITFELIPQTFTIITLRLNR